MKLEKLAEIIEKYPDVKTLAEEIKAAGGKMVHQKEEIKCREKEIRKNGNL